jgi:DNA mismatch repair protein MutL
MGKINILPDKLISKIAAGEVVERPASVVKECLENSLDANSNSIIVDIQKAGKELISIRDDGDGIEPDDIDKLFYRHSTSKLKNIEDLYKISSLGFRGEALYSIGAVADVILKSRHKNNSQTGKEIHIRGGEKIKVRDIGHPIGTTIEIRELFFNTPARKKFLKTDSTEFRQIVNIFTPYCLLYFDKKFSLTHNNRKILNYNPVREDILRISEVLNANKENIITSEKKFMKEGFSCKIFLGDINLQRPRRDQQFIFVNNRPVYCQSVSYSVNQVYRSLLPRDVYPIFVIYINLPYVDVDANIHPSKKEVKLKNDLTISSAISRFAFELLATKGKVAEVKREDTHFSQESSVFLKSRPISDNIQEQVFFNDKTQFKHNEETCEHIQPTTIQQKLKEANYIGSYKNKYLFFESGDTLLLIDQHAAHERVNYEKLKNQFETGSVEVQQLLSPMILKLNIEEMALWEEGNTKLEEIGFLTTRWDSNSIALHGFPQLIRNPEISVRNLLAEKQVKMLSEEQLARRACRGSVLAGERLNEIEAVHIKNSLLKCKVPFVCPHGRPTVVEFSESFLDRQFLR